MISDAFAEYFQYLSAAIVGYLALATIQLNSGPFRGPFALPLIGSIEVLYHILTFTTPELGAKIVGRYGNGVVKNRFLGEIEYYVTDAEEADKIMKTTLRSDFLGANIRGIMDYALFAMKSDDVWHKHRKLIQPGFSPLHLTYAAQVTLKCADDIIGVISDLNKKSSEKNSIAILPLISRVTLDVVSLVAFGEDCGAILKPDPENVIQFGFEKMTFKPLTMRLGIPPFLWPVFGLGVKSPWILHNRKLFRNYLDGVIERAEAKKIAKEVDIHDSKFDRTLNVMQRLLKSEEQRIISREEVIGEVLGFFIAGAETTSNTFTFCLMELCQNPDIQTRLYDSIKDTALDFNDKLVETVNSLKFLDNVVKETLRRHATVPQIDRVSDVDLLVCGKVIPKGGRILIGISQLHLSEKYWKTPLQFNPDRWDTDKIILGSYQPFGNGQRVCIGSKMALLELKVVLCRLLQKFRFEYDESSMLKFESKITYAVLGFKSFAHPRK